MTLLLKLSFWSLFGFFASLFFAICGLPARATAHSFIVDVLADELAEVEGLDEKIRTLRMARLVSDYLFGEGNDRK